MHLAAALVVGQCSEALLPRCTTVETTGTWSGETFIPSSTPPCYYGVPTGLETLDLLAGSWFFMVGGSNTWTLYESFGNQVDPFVYRFDGARGSDEPDFTDLIMERQADGTYQQTHLSYQPTGTGNEDLEGAVPEYWAGAVRISFYHARYYPNISAGMTKMQQGPNGWAGARRIVYAQAGHWYETNKDDRTEDHLPELVDFLAAHQAVCSGRDACFLSSVSCIELDWYTLHTWRKCNAADQRFKSEVMGHIGSGGPYSSAFTFVETDTFVSQKWQEFPGHNTPQLALWTVWLMLNALPEATRAFGSAPTGCRETVDFAVSCNAYEDGKSVLPQSPTATCDLDGCDCLGYRLYMQGEACATCIYREWQCANFRDCVYERTWPGSRTRATHELPDPAWANDTAKPPAQGGALVP